MGGTEIGSAISRTRAAAPGIVIALSMGFLALLAAGCGDENPTHPHTYTVSGSVCYSVTPLNGVRLELIQGSFASAPLDTAFSEDGAYAFTSVSPGDDYYVKAYGPSPDYFSWIAYGLSVHDDVTLNVQLKKIITLSSPADGATVHTPTPTLTWQPNSETVRYSIQLNVTNGWQLVEMGNSSSTTYTVTTPLSVGVNYTWQVGGYDDHGNVVGGTFDSFQFTVASR